MSKTTNSNHIEQNAQRLNALSVINADRHDLLHKIINSAPDNLLDKSQLNTYFSQEQQTLKSKPRWFNTVKVYSGIAVIAILVIGSGTLMWVGFTRNNNSTQFNQSQLQANGKLNNAINTINQQTSEESALVKSSPTEQPSVSTAEQGLNQLEESLDVQF
jgi:hypothetical protein